MNTQSNGILNKKIEAYRIELNELSTQIEKERLESNEENPSLQELLDKKEFILGQIEELENPDETITGEDSNEIGKKYIVNHKGKDTSFVIVIPTETDPSKGHISSQSPLAKALEGKKTGDIIEVNTPLGKVKYKIKTVKN